MSRAGELTRPQITFSTTPLTLKGVCICPCALHLLFSLSQYFEVLYARDCSCIYKLVIDLDHPQIWLCRFAINRRISTCIVHGANAVRCMYVCMKEILLLFDSEG